MKKEWGLYLMAFRNIFDYKNIAERKELNWFFLFMFIFWMLSSVFFMGCCILMAVLGKNNIAAVLLVAFFIYGIIFCLGHTLPLISLVKRRFNLIAPKKFGIFFGSWLGVWVIQLMICIYLFLTATSSLNNINMLTILSLGFLNTICGLLVTSTLIFLMIRQKPIC